MPNPLFKAKDLNLAVDLNINLMEDSSKNGDWKNFLLFQATMLDGRVVQWSCYWSQQESSCQLKIQQG